MVGWPEDCANFAQIMAVERRDGIFMNFGLAAAVRLSICFGKARLALATLPLLLASVACSQGSLVAGRLPETEPQYLQVIPSGDGFMLVSISPFDGTADTLVVDNPLRDIVTMSTSHVGFLSALDAVDIITGVSGLDYVCDSALLARAGKGLVVEVGHEAAPDYERILSLKPDVLLTYSVSAAESRFVSRLRSLGTRVFTVHEHFEQKPLARASYIRLFGVLAGKMQMADSVFNAVCEKYRSLRETVSGEPRMALLNIPYNDQWFIPTRENYIVNMISDAGGTVLGSPESGSTPSSISLEEAYSLSKKADCWLNLSWCGSLEALFSANPAFEDFYVNISTNAMGRGVSGPVVWNDNLRLGPKGGNAIWESGVVHPELVLEDLIRILHPEDETPNGIPSLDSGERTSSNSPRRSVGALLNYYRPLD